MAELLLHTFERPNHVAGGYRPGDIIIVKPDGWSWGSGELREFFVLRVPDAWYTDWSPAYDFQQEEVPARDAPLRFVRPTDDPDDLVEVRLRSRRYFVDLARLRASDRIKVKRTSDPKEVVTAADLGMDKSFIADKEDLEPRFTTTNTERRSRPLS